MTKAKSFDVLDCERSNVNHRHGYFQPIVGWWTMTVEPFDVVIRVGHLAECGSCAVWGHNAVKSMNAENIPSDGPHHEWINGIVIALALPNWGWYEFLGGDGQNLLLAAMPGLWRENGWFGNKNWTKMSTSILLESSFQRLSIGVKTLWFVCVNIQHYFLKVQTIAASMSFLLCPD